MNEDTIDAASEIATIFEALDVPYMIGGSVASTLWGEPRFTLDVDFVTALEGAHVDLLVEVDVFVPFAGGFDESKWARVRREAVDPESSRRLCITSPEDIVLQKLDWYRRGGAVSENQWREVTALLRIQAGNLDDEYLDLWAENMELIELLARARLGGD